MHGLALTGNVQVMKAAAESIHMHKKRFTSQLTSLIPIVFQKFKMCNKRQITSHKLNGKENIDTTIHVYDLDQIQCRLFSVQAYEKVCSRKVPHHQIFKIKRSINSNLHPASEGQNNFNTPVTTITVTVTKAQSTKNTGHKTGHNFKK